MVDRFLVWLGAGVVVVGVSAAVVAGSGIAMAGLFADGNTALADSAVAAGYPGPIPDRVVLMGHSLGGGAVSGVAGYMTKNGSADQLAGVVLLDGVGMNGQMAGDLGKVDGNVPIYQLAAPRYIWNMFGSGTNALVDLPNSLPRPYLLNFLEPFMALSSGLFTLQPGCLRESTGTAASCTQSVAV
jgi:hypothetical protein